MKKLIVLTLAVLMVLGLFAGCQPADNSGKPVLKVAVSPDFSPMEFVDPTKTGQDKFVGFDISLAKFIAEELGMTEEEIISGVANYLTTGSRMRRVKLNDDRLLVDDCYNANPQAMLSALRILRP